MSIFKRILEERTTRRRSSAGETSKSSTVTNTAASNLEKTVSKKTPKSVAAASDVGDPKLRTDAANTAARSAQTTPRSKVKLGDVTQGGEVRIIKPERKPPTPKDIKNLHRMITADPETAKKLQAGMSSSKRAAEVMGSGVDRITDTGERTRTRPTARVAGGEVDPSEVAAARKRGRDLTGGTVKNEPLVGGQKKPPKLARRSVRGSYVVKQDQVSKLQKGYRQLEKLRAFTRAGKSTRARMSRAYGKNLAATGDAIIQSIRDKAKAETAVKSKSIVPSQTAAITKSSKGVLVPPASTKIEPVKIKVDDPPRSKPYRGIGVGSKETVSKPTVSKTTKVPELKQPKVPELKQPEVPELKQPKVTGGSPRATDRVGSTPAPVKPKLTVAQQKKVTQRILKSANPKLGRRLATKTVPNLAAKVTTQAAKVKAPKITAGGVAGGALSALGAGFDVVQGRDDAKKAGASDTRAWLRGAARATGGLLGGSLGASGGGLVGGIAGYSAGSALADKTFTALAGATDAQKAWMKRANLANQKGTAVDKVKYRKGNQAVIYDPRVKKERIGTLDPTSGRFKADNLAKSKAYTAKNPFERLGRQFARSNEGSGLFGLNIVKGHALADMAKRYYADKDEKARVKRVSDFKKAASAK